MKTESASTGVDDAFADHLLVLDEALAAGQSITSTGAATPADFGQRLERGLKALHALQNLRRLKSEPPSTLHSHDTVSRVGDAKEARPARLGRFVIIQEIGRGGFGVVFRARDPKLHRDVALKVPHAAALLDPQMRERFHREAQAAGSLDHPNIVPVYEVDEQGPIVAIAYAYCPGITLSAWMTEHAEHVPAEDAARLIADLADAAQHAHERGVVHRDLKPSNVILQINEGELTDEESPGSAAAVGDLRSAVPRITDFGLAKRTGDEADMTRTGAVLGTPAYMAPEQARGKGGSAGQPADVYALGAILYELLTGRPPFRGESDLDTLQQLAQQEPIAPRQLRPKLPRDLETVCLKCLEKDPARRYAAAADLRDDLRRFLDHRHVQARPVGPLAPLIRWCRRKPVVAGLAAALIAAVTLGAAATLREYRRADGERVRANEERNEAIAQRDRARRLLSHANAMLQRVQQVGERLQGNTLTVSAGREILRESVKYYDALVAEAGEDPDMHRAVIQAALAAGAAQKDLGELDKAAESYRHAITSLYGIAAADRKVDDALQGIVAHLRLGHVYLDQRRYADAGEQYRVTVELCQPLLAAPPVDIRVRREHALAILHQGLIQRHVVNIPAGLPSFEQAVGEMRATLNDHPNDATVTLDLAQALDYVAATLLDMGRFDDAETQCREALELRRAAVVNNGRSTAAKLALAGSYGRLGDIAKRAGHNAAAHEAFIAGAAEFDRLISSAPSNLYAFRDYAQMLSIHAQLLESEHRYAEAAAKSRKVVALRTRCVDLQVRSVRRKVELAEAAAQAARTCINAKDYPAARKFVETAKQVQGQIQSPPAEFTQALHTVATMIQAVERALAASEKSVHARPTPPVTPARTLSHVSSPIRSTGILPR